MISSLSECQIAGVSVGVQITVREFENTEGYEIRFPDQSLVQYPCGIHICDYEKEKKITRRAIGFLTWYAFGIHVMIVLSRDKLVSFTQCLQIELLTKKANCHLPVLLKLIRGKAYPKGAIFT